jgi:hypothetical protein
MEMQQHKPHKFFERFLNNDLNELSEFLQNQYKLIEEAKLRGVDELNEKDKAWLSSGSISTVKWTEYNVFQFYHPSLHKLYKSISDMVRDACEYYGVNFAEQNYYIQGWFNVNHAKVGKLDWHDHGKPYAPQFHGYYCVSAEPSVTHYRLFNSDEGIIDNHNINNRAIVSEMGHPHAMGDWDWEGPRITIAYDIIPGEMLQYNEHAPQQHWIPLN